MQNVQAMVWLNPLTPNLEAKLAALVETADEAAAIATVTEAFPTATVEPPKQTTPAATPDETPDPVTIATLRNLGGAMKEAGKMNDFVEALTREGCAKLSDLPVERYAGFAEKLHQILGA